MVVVVAIIIIIIIINNIIISISNSISISIISVSIIIITIMSSIVIIIIVVNNISVVSAVTHFLAQLTGISPPKAGPCLIFLLCKTTPCTQEVAIKTDGNHIARQRMFLKFDMCSLFRNHLPLPGRNSVRASGKGRGDGEGGGGEREWRKGRGMGGGGGAKEVIEKGARKS